MGHMQYEVKILGYDEEKGTGSGKVTSTGKNRVTVEGWKIPLSLIQDVDGKKFKMWQ